MIVRMLCWRRRFWALGTVGLLFLAICPASPSVMAQEPDPQERLVVVNRINGEVLRVPLESIEVDGVRNDAGGLVSWDEVQDLAASNRLLGDDASAIVVKLRGEGLLQVRSVLAANGLVTMTTDLAEIKYPLVDIESIRFPKPEGTSEWEALLEERSTEEDRLLVTTSRGPRTVAGLLEGMDAEAVRIVFEGEERRVTWDKILGIVPAELEESADPKFTVQLVDRSVLIADSIRVQNGIWQLAWKGEELSIPANMLVSLRVCSDRVLYLSDLDPVVDEVQTIIAPAAEQRRNVNVFGQPLSLRLPAPEGKDNSVAEVQTFLRGWGTRSRGRLVFELPSGFERLRGWVGVDPSANGQGVCQAVVLVDGIQLFSHELSGRQPGVALDIPLTGGRRLELLVEPGPQLDLSDWVNWADIRLQK